MTIVYLSDYRCRAESEETLTQDIIRVHALTTLAIARIADVTGPMRACANIFADIQGCLREAALHHDRCMSACDLEDLEEMIRVRDEIREKMRDGGASHETSQWRP
jgi:hypothetical protein